MTASVASCSSERQCSVDVSQAETCSSPLKLNEEQEEIVRKQVPASDFKRMKLQEGLRRNWDKFYLRNKSNFFKDRWWTQHEFHGLLKQHVNLQVSRSTRIVHFYLCLPKTITMIVHAYRVGLIKSVTNEFVASLCRCKQSSCKHL